MLGFITSAAGGADNLVHTQTALKPSAWKISLFCPCKEIYMSLSKLEIPHRQPRQDELRHQNGGQPPTEIPVLRLVVEQVHAQVRPQAAPQQRQ